MRSYFYVCGCKCGQKSEALKKDEYIRLREDELWLANECEIENAEEVRKAYGGLIVHLSDY